MMNREQHNIPQHIAIIMDGNGRWAMERGEDRSIGHREGVETVKRITSECVRMGVKFLTLYTFSTENWNRPAKEVATLMGLVITALEDELFMKNNVRFSVIGDIERLPDEVQKKLHYMIDRTAANDAMVLTIALSYSSRWEITKAVRDIATEIVENAADSQSALKAIDEIDEDKVSEHMQTNFMPDPDLLIRTGGELRISNYLLWQIAYSELYFCDTYWPDFQEEDLHKAVESYQKRQRRYGKTEQQIENEKNINDE